MRAARHRQSLFEELHRYSTRPQQSGFRCSSPVIILIGCGPFQEVSGGLFIIDGPEVDV
jgi:hypothetical protein